MNILDLPTEIHLCILDLFLIYDKPIHSFCSHHDHPTRKRLQSHFPIFLICQKFYQASLRIFYGKNDFVWHCGLAVPKYKPEFSDIHETTFEYICHWNHYLPDLHCSYLTSVGVVINWPQTMLKHAPTTSNSSVFKAINLLADLAERAPNLRELTILGYLNTLRAPLRMKLVYFDYFSQIVEVIGRMKVLKTLKLSQEFFDSNARYYLEDPRTIRKSDSEISVMSLLGPV
jgi:hypothetical protein